MKASHADPRRRPWIVHTYSIVVCDGDRGDLGSASASCALAVGGAIAYSRLGVGVVNTQHHANLQLGEVALNRINAGIAPQQALEFALAQDEEPEERQLIAIDARNRKGAWTGERCAKVHTHVLGDNCVAAGNYLESESVVERMVHVFEHTLGEPLGLRMLCALEAAEAEGGDRRGQQSASVKVLPADPRRAHEINLDLRVDDHEQPLAELHRLYRVFEDTYR